MGKFSFAVAFASLFAALGASSASAQTTLIDFHDAETTLTSSFQTLVGVVGSAAPRAAFGKVVIHNNSTGVRAGECRLDMAGVSTDFAEWNLDPGTTITVSLQVAADPASSVTIGLTCRVTSGTTTNVTAEWAKVITMVVGSVTADDD